MPATYPDIISNPSILEPFAALEQVALTCMRCGVNYTTTKRNIQSSVFGVKSLTKNFCSKTCSQKDKVKEVSVTCLGCSIVFKKKPSQMRNKNHFCSKSCSASFNNKNKSHGTRRSKLEAWLEEQLADRYPNLPMEFNSKEAIGSELDIYIPSLKLAFELNGIFHYEPIFGEEKLSSVQSNDQNKFQACIREEISLCIIDTTSQKYFKPKTSKKFLDIITKIIDERCGAPSDL